MNLRKEAAQIQCMNNDIWNQMPQRATHAFLTKEKEGSDQTPWLGSGFAGIDILTKKPF